MALPTGFALTVGGCLTKGAPHYVVFSVLADAPAALGEVSQLRAVVEGPEYQGGPLVLIEAGTAAVQGEVRLGEPGFSNFQPPTLVHVPQQMDTVRLRDQAIKLVVKIHGWLPSTTYTSTTVTTITATTSEFDENATAFTTNTSTTATSTVTTFTLTTTDPAVQPTAFGQGAPNASFSILSY